MKIIGGPNDNTNDNTNGNGLGSGLGEPRNLLKAVIDIYGITPHSLSKLTGIGADIISDYAGGINDLSDLPTLTRMLFHEKVTMLSIGMQMVNENERVKGLIEHLNDQFDISLETIAIYAKLDSNEVQTFMIDYESLTYDKRYRLAVASLFLHYLFKH